MLLFSANAVAQVVPSFTVQRPFRNAVFIPNKGQFDGWNQTQDSVLFGVAHDAELFRFTRHGVYTRLFTIEKLRRREREREERELREESARNGKRRERERMPEIYESFAGMEWVGSNPNATIDVSEKQEGYFTYAVKDASGAVHGVQSDGWKKITYRNLYPGIDVEYVLPDKGGIKYSIIVHPGADPAQIKIRYNGDVRSTALGADGNFEIKTANGFIREMAPESFYENGSAVQSRFAFRSNILCFDFPQGYDQQKTLVIDPWVVTSLANLVNTNCAYDVDLDNFGNLYVYGGGDPTGGGTPPYEVAKYSPTGALLWTFNGVVVTPSWSSSGQLLYAPGNFVVERTTGKVYLCQDCGNPGTQIIRLDANGVYDNLISAGTLYMSEGWDMAFNCSTGQVYLLGGGIGGNYSLGIVNSTTGAVTIENITGTTGGSAEDVVNVTMDKTGTMYCNIASGYATLNNYIYRINATVNGNVWNVYSGYNAFFEGNNKPYIPMFFSGNGFNALTVNTSTLFYYDGVHLQAHDKTTGAVLGTPASIAAQTMRYQGGIAVDECNNLYVGGIGQIYMYTFNGANFIANGSIPLGATLAADHVHDIRFDESTNSLFVCGENFVGVYPAAASGNCNTLQISGSINCAGFGSATVTTTIANPVLTYTWYDNAGNIVGTTTGTTNLTDTISGLSNTGTYIVTVQIDPQCNGAKAADTVQAGTVPMNISNVQDVTCFGLSNGSATAVVNGGNPPIQYVWNTTPVQNTATATNLGAGTYSCIVTDADGCTDTLTVTITQPTALTGTISGNATQCPGAANTLSISPGGGTPVYNVAWNPGGGSGNNFTVNPNSTTTYTATITDLNGCTRIDSFLVDVLSVGTVALTASPGGCAPWTVNFTDQSAPPVNGAITGWLWDFGDGNTSTSQNPSHQYTTPGNYTVTLVVTFTGGCTATATLPGTIPIYVSPQANFSVSDLGAGEYAFTNLSTNASSWSWDFGDGGFSGDPNPQHVYDLLAVEPPVPVTLVVTSTNGCTDTITLPVDVRDFTLYIPNSFTPNSNGFNDGFIAQGTGITSYEMWIFDRWGMLIFHGTDIHQPWDGTYKGKPVQMDTYVYKITAGDVYGNTHDYIGGVSVVR